MLLVLTAIMLCAILSVSLHGAIVDGPRVDFVGFNGVSVLIGFVLFLGASVLVGPMVGFSLIVSALLHEWGRVLAHRMIGNGNVRFRLLPFVTRVAVSDQPVQTEGAAFLVAIMGSAISVAPLALAYALSEVLSPAYPTLASAFFIFAVTCGALNFVILLPFAPLTGGVCTRLFAVNFWPALAPGMTVFMAAMCASAGLRTGSVALLILAVVGAQSLLHRGKTTLAPMGPQNALTAMATYTFVMATHFSAGYWILETYL
jgi:hypothetical protein